MGSPQAQEVLERNTSFRPEWRVTRACQLRCLYASALLVHALEALDFWRTVGLLLAEIRFLLQFSDSSCRACAEYADHINSVWERRVQHKYQREF